MSEAHISQSIRLRLSQGICRLFRNNVGTAWQGDATMLPNGDVLIRRPRRVTYGLMVGSADLIGWRSIRVTPPMVGTVLGQFTSIEVKTKDGKIEDEQRNWCRRVIEAGGLGGIVRSVEEAEKLVAERPASA